MKPVTSLKFLHFMLSNRAKPYLDRPDKFLINRPSQPYAAMNTDKPLRPLTLRTAALSLLAVISQATLANAQTPTPPASVTVQPSSPQSLVNADPNYEAVRERLMNQPPGDVTFDRASLSTVLRMLATKAGIKWLSAQQNK